MPLVPPYIESLHPYEPGRSLEEVKKTYGLERVAKLGSNENQLGPSPLAIAAIARCLPNVNFYPNAGLDLRERLAERFHLKVGNVIAGTGSDGIMSVLIRTFLCDDDEVLTTEAAFIGFQVSAKAARHRVSHGALSRLALRSAGACRGDYRENKNHLSVESEQSDGHHFHAPASSRIFTPRFRSACSSSWMRLISNTPARIPSIRIRWIIATTT